MSEKVQPPAPRRRKLSAEELRDRSFRQIFADSLRSGQAGALSMAVQVSALMWMRTIMNTQYRYGGSVAETTRRLYGEGGLRRFYRGYPVALVQGPVARFGDTFANTFFLAAMEKSEQMRGLPVFVKTFGASVTAGLFRIFFVPLDTLKTMLQVEGARGPSILAAKYRVGGLPVFYHGAMATWAATLVGHYPWFLTYNMLNERLPQPEGRLQTLLRQACMGFLSSVVSDCCSNSLRIIKTSRQTAAVARSYGEVAAEILAKEGLRGLFGRGLKMRIATNGCQGLLFSVLWKYSEELLARH